MWDYFLYQYGNQIVLLCICICFSLLGYYAKKAVDKLMQNKAIKDAAEKAALFVEQTCKDIHGDDKLAEGISAMAKLLEANGIHLTTEQLTIYVEAAVGAFNDAFEKSDSTDSGGQVVSDELLAKMTSATAKVEPDTTITAQ